MTSFPAFILPNLGPWEILVVLVVALLVFGGRLPDVGRSLGRSLTQFRRGLRDIQDEIESDEAPPPRRRLPQKLEKPRDDPPPGDSAPGASSTSAPSSD